MFILTNDNMKKAENAANAGGLSYYSMMDMAGTQCARAVDIRLKDKSVVIICGKGRNGGDGLVMAARLWELGFKKICAVLIHGEAKDPLCFKMLVKLSNYPVDIVDGSKNPMSALARVRSAQVIIDAVFGIGFKGELRGAEADLIWEANHNTNAEKYAVDIPSGLTADGEYHGQLYFHTSKTLSMIAYKPVHVLKPTAMLCGETEIMHIGLSPEDIAPFGEKYTALTSREAALLLKERPYNAYKGDFGKILLLAGSETMTGCVYLCAQGAVEAGGGLVTAAFPQGIYGTVTPKLNEPIFLPLPQTPQGQLSADSKKILGNRLGDFSVIAAGCGMGTSSDTAEVVAFLVKSSTCPLILDADGINCLAENINVLKESKAEILITPHPGEMARLTGKTAGEIAEKPIDAALDFAKEQGVTVLLKGANTVIAAPDGRVCMNYTGNPGMARGGSGDVLTGLIAGLAAQTHSLFDAACLGAYLHGLTGDILKRELGEVGVTPTRLANSLYKAFGSLEAD